MRHSPQRQAPSHNRWRQSPLHGYREAPRLIERSRTFRHINDHAPATPMNPFKSRCDPSPSHFSNCKTPFNHRTTSMYGYNHQYTNSVPRMSMIPDVSMKAASPSPFKHQPAPSHNPFGGIQAAQPNPFMQPEVQRNPFANITQSTVNISTTNPFANQARKESAKNPFDKKETQCEFKIVQPVKAMQVLQRSPVKPHADDTKLSTKEIVAQVMDYFLHSQVVDCGRGDNQTIELVETEIEYSIIKPLSQAFLSNIPVNDSFVDLYKSKNMHDVTLYFQKDGSTIDTHKIVLSTADRLKKYIRER